LITAANIQNVLLSQRVCCVSVDCSVSSTTRSSRSSSQLSSVKSESDNIFKLYFSIAFVSLNSGLSYLRRRRGYVIGVVFHLSVGLSAGLQKKLTTDLAEIFREG